MEYLLGRNVNCGRLPVRLRELAKRRCRQRTQPEHICEKHTERVNLGFHVRLQCGFRRSFTDLWAAIWRIGAIYRSVASRRNCSDFLYRFKYSLGRNAGWIRYASGIAASLFGRGHWDEGKYHTPAASFRLLCVGDI